MKTLTLFFVSVFIFSCGIQSRIASSNVAEGQDCQGGTIQEKLANCIDGLEITSEEQLPGSITRFMLRIKQPIDHSNPELGNFSQVLMLLHRSEDRPMVLGTTGYSLYSKARMEPSTILDANQITVEHRFFDSSTPAVKDWTKLDIMQSANDFHRVVSEFKKIYSKKWVNTGASKGGMTSVYHRYFYPNDVDGTVAYVAPHSFSDADTRYIDFLETVGGSELSTCRQDLVQLQKKVISRKVQLASFASGEFSHYVNEKVGALELAASELRFVFWQYGSPTKCEQIKNLEIDDNQLYALFSDISGYPDNYNDSTIDFFLAYYYQSGTELGGPSVDLVNIREDVDHIENFDIQQFFPPEVELNYVPASMEAVGNWVREQSSKIMFIYGEYDPWSAGAFDVGTSAERGSKYYVAPKANHGAKISQLALDNKIEAVKTLFRWADSDEPNLQIESLMSRVGQNSPDELIEQRQGLRP